MAELSDAIDQLSHGQYNQFKSTVSDILMDRLRARIDNEKFTVGQSVFNDEVEDELEDDELQLAAEPAELEPEETSNEEV